MEPMSSLEESGELKLLPVDLRSASVVPRAAEAESPLVAIAQSN